MVTSCGSHVFAVFARALSLMEVSKVNTKSLQRVWEGDKMWPFLDAWDTITIPTTGTFQVNMGHTASSSSSKTEPIFVREMVDSGHDVPFEAEECEEHNVGNLPLEVVEHGWSGWLVHVLLEDWELARVAVSCHPASDLCQEVQDAWKSSHRHPLCCPPVAAFETLLPSWKGCSRMKSDEMRDNELRVCMKNFL